MTDIETRIEQIAQVIAQFDDAQVPRNIRISSKEAVDQWLLNKNKEMDLRLGMTCLLYTSPSPRDATLSRMPSSA